MQSDVRSGSFLPQPATAVQCISDQVRGKGRAAREKPVSSAVAVQVSRRGDAACPTPVEAADS